MPSRLGVRNSGNGGGSCRCGSGVEGMGASVSPKNSALPGAGTAPAEGADGSGAASGVPGIASGDLGAAPPGLPAAGPPLPLTVDGCGAGGSLVPSTVPGTLELLAPSRWKIRSNRLLQRALCTLDVPSHAAHPSVAPWISMSAFVMYCFLTTTVLS